MAATNGNDVFNLIGGVPFEVGAGGTLDGLLGDDTLDWSSYLSFGFQINIDDGRFDLIGADPYFFNVIRVENFVGGGGNDRFLADSTNVSFFGGNGDDYFRMGDFGLSNFGGRYDGDGGTDTLDFSHRTTSYAVNLAANTLDTIGGGFLTGLFDMEIILAGTGNDVVTIGGNTLRILASGGNDTVNFGTEFYVDGGTYDGNLGTDALDFTDYGQDYTVNLATGIFDNSDGTRTATISGFEVLRAGAGDDTLTADGVTEQIFGNAGDDRFVFTELYLEGASFSGGSGTDTVDFTSFVQDYVVDAALDTIVQTLLGRTANLFGINAVEAGSGGDTLWGDILLTDLNGNSGADTLGVSASGLFTGMTFDGGDGIDLLDMTRNTSDVAYNINLVTTNIATITGGALSRVLNIENVTATNGNDRVIGNAAANVISTLGASDTVESGGGNDTVNGGFGNDVLRGGTDNDTMFGEADDDIVLGEAGFDFLDGGSGNDVIRGGGQADNLLGQGGNDRLFGEQGNDRLFGADGADVLSGGTENDALFGGNGDDTLTGEDGNDRVFGGFQNDYVNGGAGNDSVTGGAGFDTIIGSFGNDTMAGNFNADIFVFAGNFGQDRITDFDEFNNFERIDLSGVASIVNLADLKANHVTAFGLDLLINAGGGNTITLQNVDVNDLDNFDFIF